MTYTDHTVRILVCQLTIEYNKFIDRILLILQSNAEFAAEIAEFRRGDMPNIMSGNNFPLCYVTTASTPVIEHRSLYPSSDDNILPPEKVTLEFWAIIVTSANIDQTSMQKELHDLASIAEMILSQNIRLKSGGQDPLCATSRIYMQGRMEQYRGQLKEAMTIRIRPVLYENYDSSNLEMVAG